MKIKRKTKISLGTILLAEALLVTVLGVYVAKDQRKQQNIKDPDSLPISSDNLDMSDIDGGGFGKDDGASQGDKAGIKPTIAPGNNDKPGGEDKHADSTIPGGEDKQAGSTIPGGEGDAGDAPSEDILDTIIISAAGDVTLGRDIDYGYDRSFDDEFEKQGRDYGYFFRNVKEIFEADDLTIVNLETTLTKAEKRAVKKFRFKADPSYVEILKQGSIEAVSIANNHTLDYLEKGYQDTLTTLSEAEVGYFGYEHQYISDIRGIKVGILGYTCWESSEKQKEEIKQAIGSLKKEGVGLVIVMFHWGIERDYYPYSVQKEMAHFVIDNGADLVLGSHPHVLQGIEEYNGKNIVYSMGNFSFGGNKNPSDKDTMVYVHKFNFKNGELISQDSEVIPCSISSVKDRNNYQPTPLKGSEKERVSDKIKKISRF